MISLHQARPHKPVVYHSIGMLFPNSNIRNGDRPLSKHHVVERFAVQHTSAPTGPRVHIPILCWASIGYRSYRPPTTTLAPSFPSTPGSIGFGLRSLPLFLDRKPNIPFGFPLELLPPSLCSLFPLLALVSFLFDPSNAFPSSLLTVWSPPPLGAPALLADCLP